MRQGFKHASTKAVSIGIRQEPGTNVCHRFRLVSGDVDPQLLATLTAWCAAQGVMAEELAVERRTLEDVFLELTGRDLRA